MNQDETGVDCGGSNCPACRKYLYYRGNSYQKIDINLTVSMVSIYFSLWDVFYHSKWNFLPAATCDDGTMNQDEAGVDCGGSNCPACRKYLYYRGNVYQKIDINLEKIYTRRAYFKKL